MCRWRTRLAAIPTMRDACVASVMYAHIYIYIVHYIHTGITYIHTHHIHTTHRPAADIWNIDLSPVDRFSRTNTSTIVHIVVTHIVCIIVLPWHQPDRLHQLVERLHHLRRHPCRCATACGATTTASTSVAYVRDRHHIHIARSFAVYTTCAA